MPEFRVDPTAELVDVALVADGAGDGVVELEEAASALAGHVAVVDDERVAGDYHPLVRLGGDDCAHRFTSGRAPGSAGSPLSPAAE